MAFPLIAMLAASAIGAGATAYGANKQSKDNAAAQDENRKATDENNRLAWVNYLMSRGINPTGVTAAGQLPSSGSPINSRLPLWAIVTRPTTSPVAGFRVSGSATRPRLAVRMPATASTTPSAANPIDYGQVLN
jgi:hypothetical protein